MELIFVRKKLNRATTSTKKSDRTIVQFSRRKDCEQVMRVKKDLKDLNPTDSDFPGRGYL